MRNRIADEPRAQGVRFEADRLLVQFVGGREVAVPIEWFPRLRDAKAAARKNWRLIGGGVGIHWPDLDEDLSAAALLAPMAAKKKPARVKAPGT